MHSIFNQEIKENSLKINSFFLEIKKNIDLTDLWEKINLEKLEIKKSFLRGVLRYSILSTNLQKSIVSNLKNSKIEVKNFNWLTPVYPMIHMSSDRMESVGMHFDQIDENPMYTVWLPITEYKYPALKYIPLSEHMPSIFLKTLTKTPFINSIGKNKKVKVGEMLFWEGRFLHAGNFNKSSSIACAFQMKLTKENFLHEKSINLNSLKNFDENTIDECNNISQINLLFKSYLKIFEDIKKIKNLQINLDSKLFDEIYILSKKNNDQSNKIFSFASSVLAQRLLTSEKITKKNKELKNLIFCLDIYSIFAGAENLSSFYRVVNKKFNNSEQIISYLRNLKLDNHKVQKLLSKYET